MRQKSISLTEEQREAIRQRVCEGIKSIERGNYREYQGRRGLKKLADEIKSRGRKRLEKQTDDPISR